MNDTSVVQEIPSTPSTNDPPTSGVVNTESNVDGQLPETDVQQDGVQVPNVEVQTDPEENVEKGTEGEPAETEVEGYQPLFYATIGLTYSSTAFINGEACPQWGIGLFFDGFVIPLKFKDYVQGDNGRYRPELRFFNREDAISYAESISGRFRFKLDRKMFGHQFIKDSPTDPISQLLEYARDEGVLVNNLFQDADGSWRCNVRVESYSDFAEAPTATGAIEEAVGRMAKEMRTKYMRERLADAYRTRQSRVSKP